MNMHLTREQFQSIKQMPLFKGQIVSGSMEPLIHIGDSIVVDVNAQDLKRYDIIVFYQDGKLICHFLWNINKIVQPKLLQTKNLAQFGTDFPITMDDYLGRVVNFKIRFIDKLRLFYHILLKKK